MRKLKLCFCTEGVSRLTEDILNIAGRECVAIHGSYYLSVFAHFSIKEMVFTNWTKSDFLFESGVSLVSCLAKQSFPPRYLFLANCRFVLGKFTSLRVFLFFLCGSHIIWVGASPTSSSMGAYWLMWANQHNHNPGWHNHGLKGQQ